MISRCTGKYSILRIFAAALLCAAILFAGTAWSQPAAAQSRLSQLVLLDEIMSLLQKHHLNSISEEEMFEALIQGLFDGLNDYYGSYYPAYHKTVSEDEDAVPNTDYLVTPEQYNGIGIQLQPNDSVLYIIQVAPGSPAEAKGLLPGDIIAAINGIAVDQDNMWESIFSLSDEETSQFQLIIRRGGIEQQYDLNFAAVEWPIIESRMFNEKIGYIQFNLFTEDLPEKFDQHFESLKQQQMKSLIIDLRDNPGGYVHSAYQIASRFIENGIFMHTVDNQGHPTPVHINNGRNVGMPVTLLVNGYSASSSELFSAALHEHGVASLIGEYTYGKGIIQDVFRLSNGAAIEFTTNEYLTPNRNQVHGVGLDPDRYVYGEAAQLIDALRQNGVQKLHLTNTPYSIIINGLQFPYRFDAFAEDGKHYIPLDVVAALLGATIEWEYMEKVVIQYNGEEIVFNEDGHSLYFTRGDGFIELTQLSALFPSISWVAGNGSYVLSYEQKN